VQYHLLQRARPLAAAVPAAAAEDQVNGAAALILHWSVCLAVLQIHEILVWIRI
jgi:hypothetical protein